MRKYLLFAIILAGNFITMLAQTSFQTRTPGNVNNLNQFKQVYGDLNYAGARAKNLDSDDNRFVSSRRLSAASDSAGPFSNNSFSILALQGFGFSIPSDAIIENIVIRLRRFKTGSAPVGDHTLSLIQRFQCNEPGLICRYGVFWTHHDTYDGKIYPAVETEYVFSQNGSGNNGGFNHNEAYQWTPAIINQVTFGVRIDNYPPIGEGYAKIHYDLVEVTVEYSQPTTRANRSPVMREENISKAPIVYPNPFTAKTTIQFVAAATGKANVELYDISGSKVRVLYTGEVVQGQTYYVEAGDALLPKGIYIFRINNGQHRHMGKIIKLE